VFPLKEGTISTTSTDLLKESRLWYCERMNLSVDSQLFQLLLLLDVGFDDILRVLPKSTGIRWNVRKACHPLVIALSRKMLVSHNKNDLSQHWNDWAMGKRRRQMVECIIITVEAKSDSWSRSQM
jgi:hypothetical protein